MADRTETKKLVKKVTYFREGNMSAIAFLSLLATIFSGYLFYTNFFKDSCLLKEGCAYILGFPSCFYGFILFGLIFLLSFLGMTSKTHFTKPVRLLSIIGILFTGFLGIYELFFAPANIFNSSFTLLLPSCVYGLVLFLAIYILS